jgi:hypothetical protein
VFLADFMPITYKCMKYAPQIPFHLALPIRTDDCGRKGKFPPQIIILAMRKKMQQEDRPEAGVFGELELGTTLKAG